MSNQSKIVFIGKDGNPDKTEEHKGVGMLLEKQFTINYTIGGYYVVSNACLRLLNDAKIQYKEIEN